MKLLEAQYKKLKYYISYPDAYREGDIYPVIFHTHGAGGRGDDLKKMNIDAIIKNNPEIEKFIIVAPQCYANTWFEIFEQLIEFCEYVYAQPFTDRTRFYGSGISMGGYGCYQLMMSRPKLFAAGLVNCGGGMYWNIARLKTVPVRAFHGAQDKTVLPRESERMIERLKEVGGDGELFIFPECAHNCWDTAYANGENFLWLLTHTKVCEENAE